MDMFIYKLAFGSVLGVNLHGKLQYFTQADASMFQEISNGNRQTDPYLMATAQQTLAYFPGGLLVPFSFSKRNVPSSTPSWFYCKKNPSFHTSFRRAWICSALSSLKSPGLWTLFRWICCLSNLAVHPWKWRLPPDFRGKLLVSGRVDLVRISVDP